MSFTCSSATLYNILIGFSVCHLAILVLYSFTSLMWVGDANSWAPSGIALSFCYLFCVFGHLNWPRSVLCFPWIPSAPIFMSDSTLVAGMTFTWQGKGLSGCWHDFHLAGQRAFSKVTVSSTCLTSVV